MAWNIFAGTNVQDTGRDTTVWARFEGYYDGASSHLRYNDATATTGNPGSATPGGVTLGALGGGISVWLDCSIAEVIVYSSAVSAADRTSISTYLASRYGL